MNGGEERSGWNALLERFSLAAAQWSSGSGGFGFALALVLAWLVAGPFVGYSDTWQIAINTGTTILTFLMVFLIQRSQAKDALAIQLKLDEIVAALAGASNDLLRAEELSEAELSVLRQRYQDLSQRARRLSDRRAAVAADGDDLPKQRRKRRGR
jgi:low affinity Fe/Cu permease